MDQNFNNNQHDFLWTMLADPANGAWQHTTALQQLVKEYPQSGILQALLAHASDEKNIAQAAVYFNPKALYKLINAPASFTDVTEGQLIIQNRLRNAVVYQGEEEITVAEKTITAEELTTDQQDTPNYFNEQQVSEEAGEDPIQAVTSAEQVEEPLEQLIDEEAELNPDQVVDNPEDAAETTEQAVVEDAGEESEQAVDNPVEIEEVVDQQTTEETPEAITQTVDSPEENQDILEQPVVEEAGESPEQAADSPQETEALIEQPITEGAGEEPMQAVDSPEELEEFVDQPIEATVEEDTQETKVENIEAETATDELVESDSVAEESIEEVEEKEGPVAAAIEPAAENVVQDEPTATTKAEESVQEHWVASENTAESAVAEDASDEQHVEEAAEEPTYQHDEIKEEHPSEAIDEETFDEITGIDNIDVEPVEHHVQHDISNDSSFSYFKPDNDFAENQRKAHDENIAAISAENEQNAPDAEQQELSKYHDDKMPYSFMWWLDKTRREHASVYQPYIKAVSAGESQQEKKTGDELQQQYYENIFHITSVDELDKSTAPYAPVAQVKRKEQVIIERFIHEEPQIRPQSSDKLDNENKAKRSSEDKDELVTETLAAIYAEQMLYHKAIASYKKLMLKFPEKSSYFAEKIEQLEKKTN